VRSVVFKARKERDDTAIIRKSSPLDLDYLESLNTTTDEWASNEDEQAYKKLSEVFLLS
jgi:hypothetical protein